MKPWPRTLGMQLIAVTAAAVFLSNVAVAVWFERGSVQESEAAQTERILDRVTSMGVLLSAIPPRARATAAQAMGSAAWRFDLRSGKAVAQPMNDDEARLAARLKAMLPPEKANFPVSVKFANALPGPLEGQDRRPHRPGPAIVMTIPIVRNTQLVATFFRPPASPWPMEMVVAATLAIIVASAAGAYMARRVAQPLSQLASAATVAAAGGSAPRVPEEGPDDVKNAAIAFNKMTDQVRRTLESQRQLLSAVGHDLRTPITAMRISLEFVADPELREGLEKNLDELQELTEAVLSSARGTGGEAMRSVDLSSLIDSVCADLDDLGEPVTWQASGPAPLACRPNEIKRAVRNLVENAVAYGRKADVKLNVSPAGYEIVIEDQGPGIPATEQSRVFEPFVRLESSRNSATGGTGLGLTLVKAIAEGHGGAIVLENRNEGGLRARMNLPRLVSAA
jgi:signal transduction histidine kinase